MFIDEVTIKVIAGKGGDGCTSFRHEKYIELGGPDGGNGGHGGDVIFKAEKGLKTLIDLRYMKTVKAKPGESGKGKDCTGASAENTVIKVPTGTTVRDGETGLIIADLVKDGEEATVALGGRGGKGNAAFKTNKNKAPYTSEYGEPGETKILNCELKLLADVGLVGFPSVGKSSLISVVSAAKPKIADYHFTTLVPNLGVVKLNDYSFVIADLPGLIKGSSEGVGLGDRFLRHLSRTKVICHIIDMSATDGRDPVEDYNIIREELRKYSETLYKKEEVVVANKMDLPDAKVHLELFKEKFPDIKIFEISAVTKEGLEPLLYKLADLLRKTEDEPIYEESEYEDYALYEYKNEIPFEIIKEKDGYRIVGKTIEKVFKMTKFNSEESEMRFAKKLKNLGVDEALRTQGIEEGDIVKIYDYEFEYEDY